ncbi:hypothetical protein BDP27DRAFT_1374996 [Rhodocollybia butyracea]|uniref:Uncharacterized protein n=1 Tax=Rhodocollybia butyracea TaxID=206335 RepID=A0A9P5P487_9AGAR|nr:hypothetical protein BDP27DRAFT_1374996 [Rhodocollybia butyracea]
MSTPIQRRKICSGFDCVLLSKQSQSRGERKNDSHSPFPVTRSTSPDTVDESIPEVTEVTPGGEFVLVPGYFLELVPVPGQTSVEGTVFGLYFGIEFADAQKTLFDLITIRKIVGRRLGFERRVDFWSKFGFDVTGDDFYLTTIIHDRRRYLVVGTYDQHLAERNMSLESVGCTDEYKGDIAVCFFGKRQRQHFLQGLPFYESTEKRDDALRKVLKALIKNITSHVEHGEVLAYKFQQVSLLLEIFENGDNEDSDRRRNNDKMNKVG